MVMCQRLAPVAGSCDAFKACLEGVISVFHQLNEQVCDAGGSEHDVGIHQQDPPGGAVLDAKRAGPGQAAALVTKDPGAGSAGNFDRAVGGQPVHHDDFRDTGLTQGFQTARKQLLRVAGRNDRGDVCCAVAHRDPP